MDCPLTIGDGALLDGGVGDLDDDDGDIKAGRGGGRGGATLCSLLTFDGAC